MTRTSVFAPGELTDKLIVERDGAVGWLVFNNPARRNALSLEMCEAIPKVLERFEADAEVRVVVLTGQGGAFMSGADISQFEAQRSGKEAVQQYERIAESALERLQSCDRPVLAMIRGYCLGAGVNIANCCDLRIAAEDARFGIPAAKLGLGYRVSSTKMLVDLLGAARAKEVLMTGRQFNAQEAKEMGLVHRVVANDALEATIAQYCAELAANAPLTMRSSKRVIHELLRHPESYDKAACTAIVRACYDSEDYAEGRRAFMEKRKPAFRGR